MKLPVQETPNFNTHLPLSKQNVKFRPFLVKEQKNLMMAREGKNAKEIFDAICDIISHVTFDKIDALKLPMVDLEYLFLQIRMRSIGETSKIGLQCQNCQHKHDITVDLESIKIDTDKLPENKIQISDSLMIELEFPTAGSALIVDELQEVDAIKPLLRTNMVRIYDESEIYELKDFPDSEINNFIESLTLDQFAEIMNFFNDLPSLEKNIEYKCSNCGTENKINLKGLQSFF